MDRPLEPHTEQWQAMAAAGLAYLTDVLRDLLAAPASDHSDVAALLADPDLRRDPPETGRPLPELLDVIDRAAYTGSTRPTPTTWRSSPAADWSAPPWPG